MRDFCVAWGIPRPSRTRAQRYRHCSDASRPSTPGLRSAERRHRLQHLSRRRRPHQRGGSSGATCAGLGVTPISTCSARRCERLPTSRAHWTGPVAKMEEHASLELLVRSCKSGREDHRPSTPFRSWMPPDSRYDGFAAHAGPSDDGERNALARGSAQTSRFAWCARLLSAGRGLQSGAAGCAAPVCVAGPIPTPIIHTGGDILAAGFDRRRNGLFLAHEAAAIPFTGGRCRHWTVLARIRAAER